MNLHFSSKFNLDFIQIGENLNQNYISASSLFKKDTIFVPGVEKNGFSLIFIIKKGFLV